MDVRLINANIMSMIENHQIPIICIKPVFIMVTRKFKLKI